jgi:DNA repair protein SbcD/Mre11
MRILHTADWHLGKKLSEKSRYDEQKAVLQEIVDIANREAANLVLLAGDLFDTFAPTPEAEDLLYSTLKALTDGGRRPVVAIAGNHDNPDRIEAQDHFARECGIVFAGYPKTEVKLIALSCDAKLLRSEPGFVEIQLPDFEYPARIILTPYANEIRLRQAFLDLDNPDDELRNHLYKHWQRLADTYMDEQGVNLLTAHLFMMKRGGEQPDEPDDERSIVQVGGASVLFTDLIPSQIQYVAMGHLHRYQQIGGGPCPVVYSSSPLAYSFAEANQQKYVVLVDAEPGKAVTVTPVALQNGRKLLRKTFTEVPQAISWLRENPECFPEIKIQTPTFLSSDEHRELTQAHERFAGVRLEVRELLDTEIDTELFPDKKPSSPQIDLSLSMTELFAGYFKHKHKQDPNPRLLDLFQEILQTTPNQPL